MILQSDTQNPNSGNRLYSHGPLLVLMYHNLFETESAYSSLSPSITSYFVSAHRFAEQLTELESSGIRWLDPLSLSKYYGMSSEPAPSGHPGNRHIVLTFDDGWRDAVELGGPILTAHECTALYFVTTDFIGERNFLSRQDLARLAPAPFRVGSHARTHRMLAELQESEIRREVESSKKLLEDLVGYEVDCLSVPGGSVDARVRRIAVEVGYRRVFDSRVRLNRPTFSPLEIGRVAVMKNTSLDAIRRYGAHRIGRERLRRVLLSAPKRVLGQKRYQRLRRTLLGEAPGRHINHEP